MQTHVTPEILIKTTDFHLANSQGAGAVNGSALDMKGAANLRVVLLLGATGGGITASAALQHSDDNSTFVAALDDAGNAITVSKAASAAASRHMLRVRGSRLKRYVRLAVTTAGGAVIVAAVGETWGLKDTAYADGNAAYGSLV